MLQLVDLIQRTLQPRTEYILSGLARNQIDTVAPQREYILRELLGRSLGRLLDDAHAIGQHTGELRRRAGIRQRADALARSGYALRRTSIRRKKDACIDDSVRGAVYQRGTHAQILLRITRVRTDYGLLAADGNLDIERRGGIGHDRSALVRIYAYALYVVLSRCRGSDQRQHGRSREYDSFHNHRSLVHNKNSTFSYHIKISGRNRASACGTPR